VKGFVSRPVLVLVLSLAIAGSGGTLPLATAASKPQVIEISLKEFDILPREVLAKPGAVTFVVKNVGAIEHDFVVEDANGKAVARIAVISPGKQEDVQAVLRPGLYTTLCSLPGHKDAGMKGLLKVQD